MLVFKISRGARVFNCPTSFRDSIAPTRATTVKYVYYWYYTGIPGIFYCHSERHRTTVWRLSAIASPSLLPISNTKRLFLYLYYQQRKVLAQLKNNHCEHQRCALLFCSRCGVVLWCASAVPVFMTFPPRPTRIEFKRVLRPSSYAALFSPRLGVSQVDPPRTGVRDADANSACMGGHRRG